MRTNKKGFTLIELIVVISIIGILISLSIAYLSVARKKARDTRKMADFKTISTAANLYFDSYKTMPGNYNYTNCVGNIWVTDFARDNGGDMTSNSCGGITNPGYVQMNATLPRFLGTTKILKPYDYVMKTFVDKGVLEGIPKSTGGTPYSYYNFKTANISPIPVTTKWGAVLKTQLDTYDDTTIGVNNSFRQEEGGNTLFTDNCTNKIPNKDYCVSIKY